MLTIKQSYKSSSNKLKYYYKRDSSIIVTNLSGLPVPEQICQFYFNLQSYGE